MEYEEFINKKRSERQELINKFRSTTGQKEGSFDYFEISKKWKINAEVTKRKVKPSVLDYKIQFIKIGVIKVKLEENLEKFDLLQEEKNEDSLFIYIKDGSSGKDTYGLGRFAPVFKEEDKYFVEFNLASTPACGFVEGAACPWAKKATTVVISAGEKAPKYDE